MTTDQCQILLRMAQEGQQDGLHDVQAQECPPRDFRAAFERLRASGEMVEDTGCRARAGSDPCYGRKDHDDDHWTHWSKPGQVPVVMYWRGDEEWAHG